MLVLTEKTRQRIKQSFYMLLALGIFSTCTAGVFAASEASTKEQASETQNGLTEFEKEAISSIREITLRLILIAVGVFSFVGSLVTGKNKDYLHKKAIKVSFILLAVSVFFGIFAYGSLIFDLSSSTFCAGGTLRLMATGQWITFLLGGIFLICFFIKNIK